MQLCVFIFRSINDITLSYTFFKVEDEEDVEDIATADVAPSGVRLHGSGVLPQGITGATPESVQALAAAPSARSGPAAAA